MDKKLAIKGHPTRGKEVIELLEMMGGDNKWLYDGSDGFVYFIEKNDKYITFCDKERIKKGEYIIYELEEFLEKYPFKLNDKVIDEADGCPGVVCEMKWDADVSDMKYCVVFGNGIDFGWFTNDSIELCKEDNNLDETKVESTGFMQLGKTFAVIFNDANYEDEVELQLGNYEIVVRDGKTYAALRKPKYPNDYKTCCDVLYANSNHNECYEVGLRGYPIQTFARLLICRDAYWKIAGEEMGLGKDWKYDMSKDEFVYAITYQYGEIQKNEIRHKNAIIAFSTKEMRDTFYENFKDLIEQCKELL